MLMVNHWQRIKKLKDKIMLIYQLNLKWQEDKLEKIRELKMNQIDFLNNTRMMKKEKLLKLRKRKN
jgi:hypothetical protein